MGTACLLKSRSNLSAKVLLPWSVRMSATLGRKLKATAKKQLANMRNYAEIPNVFCGECRHVNFLCRIGCFQFLNMPNFKKSSRLLLGTIQ